MKAQNVNNLPWPLHVHLCFFCSSLWPGRLTPLGCTQEFPCCLASPWLQHKIGGQKGIKVTGSTSQLPPSPTTMRQELHAFFRPWEPLHFLATKA